MKKMLWSSAMLLGLSGLFSGCAMVASPGANAGPNLDANLAPASGAGVYFLEPVDGATVTSPFKVRFGLKGMEIKPAGAQVGGSGHHHLLIDLDGVAAGQIIPFDDVHIHFGKGQTETEVKLPPGTYKLTLQFADGFHLSYGKEMSKSLKVTVR